MLRARRDVQSRALGSRGRTDVDLIDVVRLLVAGFLEGIRLAVAQALSMNLAMASRMALARSEREIERAAPERLVLELMARYAKANGRDVSHHGVVGEQALVPIADLVDEDPVANAGGLVGGRSPVAAVDRMVGVRPLRILTAAQPRRTRTAATSPTSPQLVAIRASHLGDQLRQPRLGLSSRRSANRRLR